jgi:hypothetical protein
MPSDSATTSPPLELPADFLVVQGDNATWGGNTARWYVLPKHLPLIWWHLSADQVRAIRDRLSGLGGFSSRQSAVDIAALQTEHLRRSWKLLITGAP